jgi:hypothetical protein
LRAFDREIMFPDSVKLLKIQTDISGNYESPEGSFEIRDSLSEIRDSKFNILINQWEEILYNYSLLLRSIRVFMDFKNDIDRSL